jgi:predicted aspartyl protease
LKIRSSKGELDVKTLFDTGASFTVVKKELAKKNRSNPSDQYKGSYACRWEDAAQSAWLHSDFDDP